MLDAETDQTKRLSQRLQQKREEVIDTMRNLSRKTYALLALFLVLSASLVVTTSMAFVARRRDRTEPARSVISEHGTIIVPDNVETSLESVTGWGELLYFWVDTSHDDVYIRIYCDGVMVEAFAPASLYYRGFGASTPMISVTRFTADGGCTILVTVPYPFKRSFELRAFQTTGAEQSCNVRLRASII